MNRQELKNKILEIVAPYVSAGGNDEAIAEALISAGICRANDQEREDAGNPDKKYELHIMSDGKNTTAVYKKNGELVSGSEANLHPDDEFNFRTGATIAFDRVFQKD